MASDGSMPARRRGRFEARITRIVKVLADGDHERLNELLFRIATGRDHDEVMSRIEAEVRSRVAP
jgi:hypothetical protein